MENTSTLNLKDSCPTSETPIDLSLEEIFQAFSSSLPSKENRDDVK